MKSKAPTIQVIDRMTQLLDVVAAHDQAVNLKTLALQTGLHPSTAFRILASMTGHGYVERNSAGCYRLGRKLIELGCKVRDDVDIRQEARESMEWLRDQLGESINLTVRERDEMVYIERSIPRRMMRVEQVIGSRAPLHVTAVGKLMLGEMGEAALQDYAERTGLPGFTPHTLTTFKALRKEIGSAMQQGFALDNEEAEIGVGCIAVVIRDSSGSAVAGLSVSAPIERCSGAWIPLVQEAGRRISKRLGYRTESSTTRG